MNSKRAIPFCVLLAIFNVAYSQSLNRILPNCGLNGLNSLSIAEALGNQLNYLPYDLPYELLPNIYPGATQPNALQPLTKVFQQFPNPLQSLPNVLPGLPNIVQQLPNVVQTLPNVMQPLPNVIQQLPNVVQTLPNLLQPLPNVIQSLPNVLQQGVVPTVIEDNSVASNLANALQLLVVSNLLRNTLPQARDVIAPYPQVEYISSLPCGLGSPNYLY